MIVAITHIMSEEEDKLLAADKQAGVNLILGVVMSMRSLL